LNLVGVDYFSSEYVDYVKSLQYSDACPVVRVAVNKRLTDIKMMTQIGDTDLEGYHKKIENGIIPNEINQFLVIPSNFSPSVAPEGKQLVCMTSGGLVTKKGDVEQEMFEAMLRTAESCIPGLRENAIWIDTMSVKQLDKMVGEEGACVGTGQTVGQCGDNRPKIKTPIEGLYVVGGEAGGTGCGTELCVNSAIEFMDLYYPQTQIA
jgi:phytoene dehydrogenase-like protein